MVAPVGLDAAGEAHLVAAVQEQLALYLYDSARFLAERLVASFRSEVSSASAHNASQRFPVFLSQKLYHSRGEAVIVQLSTGCHVKAAIPLHPADHHLHIPPLLYCA